MNGSSSMCFLSKRSLDCWEDNYCQVLHECICISWKRTCEYKSLRLVWKRKKAVTTNQSKNLGTRDQWSELWQVLVLCDIAVWPSLQFMLFCIARCWHIFTKTCALEWINTSPPINTHKTLCMCSLEAGFITQEKKSFFFKQNCVPRHWWSKQK